MGYVLREVGELTWDLLQTHHEKGYLNGCRDGSCRLDRAAYAERVAHPAQLPSPDDPLPVARYLAKGYIHPDWSPVAEAAAQARPWPWGDALGDEPWPGIDDELWAVMRKLKEPGPTIEDMAHRADWDGPLTLRRWRGSWWAWHQAHWAAQDAEKLQADTWDALGGATFRKTSKGPEHLGGVKQSWKPWQPSPRKVSAVLEALAGVTHTDTALSPPCWLDGRTASTSLVSCTNGLLDTRTRELKDHDPEWFNLVSVPFAYDPFAPAPAAWLEFLAALWPDDPESVQALQQWFGYVLSGRTDLQKMLLVVGPPRSGKGTIVGVLQALVGRGNYAGPTLASLGTNFGLQALLDKPLAIVADARLSGKDNHTVVERLLSISGEDSLTVDRKYQAAWTGRLPTRVMILSNELPHFGDISGAIVTRFVTLVMKQSWLGREDVGLKQKLLAELPGILLWALAGLERVDRAGRFTLPASSAEEVQALADSASPMSTFVREWCTVGPEHSVKVQDLFAAWRSWCMENGRDHPGSEQTLGRTLPSVVPGVRRTRPRDSATGQQVRTYEGIGLLRRVESRHIPIPAHTTAPTTTEGD